VKMFSIYRDTYVDIGHDDDDNEYGLDKINHAYAWGNMPQAVRAVNKNLDLNARECITITWDVVRTVVDKVGGIDMNITENEYYFMKSSGHFSDDENFSGPGVNHLNGEQAVYYARMRKDSSEGDHRRNERLKDVLIAAMEESKNLDTAERIEIAEKVMDMIDTNMSNSKVTDLAVELTKYDVDSSTEWPYDTRGWMHNEIYYGVPETLESNVIKLHEELFDQDAYEPTEFVKNTSEDIIDFTGIE